MNLFKTMLLMTALTLLLLLIGNLIGGESGMMFALIFAGLMNFGAYWFSDKIVLAMYGAREVDKNSNLYRIVQRLASRAGLPMPRVYMIPTETPNAFATGRNPRHAAVAATEGITRILSQDELEGVLGHELAHVKHRDILIASIVATMAGAIMMISRMAQFAAFFGGYGRSEDEEGGGGGNIIAFLLMAIVAPIAAILIQLAISRSREYAADRGGAEISGIPLSLAKALGRLERGAAAIPMDNPNPATSHLFIVNPLRGGRLLAIFSTHPPIQERIKRLEEMARR
ncbi:zinc metalloprotease HtpX [Candidatus Poribacteria bacterium]|nr:zinc metalloprotease HtpX [Candidatus Poribacteria bacterium]